MIKLVLAMTAAAALLTTAPLVTPTTTVERDDGRTFTRRERRCD